MIARLKLWAAALGAALVALAVAALRLRRSGYRARKAEDDAETIRRLEKGRGAVRDGRGDDPDERLRRNDGQW